jgi:RHS repeat-associated protein
VHRKVENSGSLNEERVYLYDNWQVAEELKADGGSWPTDRQYIYGGRYIDEVLVMDVNTDPGTDNDCTDAGGSKRYLFCENNNWNVLALTDETGTVKERYEYDPYGAVTVTVDDSSGNPYRFQGRRYDPEQGLYYFRNRTYSPSLGRFVQRDPIGYVDGMNLYAAYFVPGGVDPAGLARPKKDCYDEALCDEKRKKCLVRVSTQFVKCMADAGYSFSGPGTAAAVSTLALEKSAYSMYSGPVGILYLGMTAISGITVYNACNRTRRWGMHQCQEIYKRCLHPDAPLIDSRFWERERLLAAFKSEVHAARRADLRMALQRTKRVRDANERLRQVFIHLVRARRSHRRAGTR